MSISRKTYAQLLVWAGEAAPKECCGLLFGAEDQIVRAEMYDNVAANPENSFEIDPAALIAAERSNRQAEKEAVTNESRNSNLIGYFHSHPNGKCEPSPRDAEQAVADGRFWLIVASGQIGLWQAAEDGCIEGRFEPKRLNIILQNP